MPRPRRILLVDDDDDSRELYAEYFGTVGYEVLQAENGAEAIETVIRRRPDVVVMDLEMPVMGGLEAIRRLKADPRTRGTPIVVLSGNGILDHAKAKAAGCEISLVRPCDYDELEAVIAVLVAPIEPQPCSRKSVAG